MFIALAAYATVHAAHCLILTNGTIHACQPALPLFLIVVQVSFCTVTNQLNACQMDIGARRTYQRNCFAI